MYDAFRTVASVAACAFAAPVSSDSTAGASAAGASSAGVSVAPSVAPASSCGGRTGWLASTASASAAEDLGSTRTSSAFEGASGPPSTRSCTLSEPATTNGSVPLPPSSMFSTSRSVHAPHSSPDFVRTSNVTEVSPS